MRTPPSFAPLGESENRFLVGCGLLLVAGAAVRIAAARCDLWIDEMWAVSTAVRIDSALGVFTELRSTANHPLLSLWFNTLGERLDELPYRAPSLLAGSATIALAAAIGARRSRVEGLLAALLVAGSYLLIHYSSEARGYALVLAFAFSAFLAARAFVERPTEQIGNGLALTFVLSTTLGMLAHPVYGAFALAVGAWVPVALWRRGRRGRPLASDLARLFALPFFFGLAYAWFFIRGLENPGGPSDAADAVVLRAAAFLFGTPVSAPGSAVACSAALLVTAVGLWRLARARDDLVLFYVLMLIALPAAIALANDGPFYVRYFLPSAAFFLLLAAEVAAAGWRRGGIPRVAAVAIISLVLAGNARHVAGLLESGRGAYTEALRHIAARSMTQVVTVGSQFPVPTGALVRFHALKVNNKLIRYVGAEPDGISPDWWIDASYDRFEPRDEWMTWRGRQYQLDGVYHYYALSGSNWFLYRALLDEAGD